MLFFLNFTRVLVNYGMKSFLTSQPQPLDEFL